MTLFPVAARDAFFADSDGVQQLPCTVGTERTAVVRLMTEPTLAQTAPPPSPPAAPTWASQLPLTSAPRPSTAAQSNLPTASKAATPALLLQPDTPHEQPPLLQDARRALHQFLSHTCDALLAGGPANDWHASSCFSVNVDLADIPGTQAARSTATQPRDLTMLADTQLPTPLLNAWVAFCHQLRTTFGVWIGRPFLVIKAGTVGNKWQALLNKVIDANLQQLQTPGISTDAALRLVARTGLEFARAWRKLVKEEPRQQPSTMAAPSAGTMILLNDMVVAVLEVVKWVWGSQRMESHEVWAAHWQRFGSAVYRWTITGWLSHASPGPLDMELGSLVLLLAVALHRATLLMGCDVPLFCQPSDIEQGLTLRCKVVASPFPSLAWDTQHIAALEVDTTARMVYAAVHALTVPAADTATGDANVGELASSVEATTNIELLASTVTTTAALPMTSTDTAVVVSSKPTKLPDDASGGDVETAPVVAYDVSTAPDPTSTTPVAGAELPGLDVMPLVMVSMDCKDSVQPAVDAAPPQAPTQVATIAISDDDQSSVEDVSSLLPPLPSPPPVEHDLRPDAPPPLLTALTTNVTTASDGESVAAAAAPMVVDAGNSTSGMAVGTSAPTALVLAPLGVAATASITMSIGSSSEVCCDAALQTRK